MSMTISLPRFGDWPAAADRLRDHAAGKLAAGRDRDMGIGAIVFLCSPDAFDGVGIGGRRTENHGGGEKGTSSSCVLLEIARIIRQAGRSCPGRDVPRDHRQGLASRRPLWHEAGQTEAAHDPLPRHRPQGRPPCPAAAWRDVEGHGLRRRPGGAGREIRGGGANGSTSSTSMASSASRSMPPPSAIRLRRRPR